ncbi:calpain-1 catalytic subunit-like [Gymnodraco acuticeps]|uniref:Calpain-1 catalytic subunit-like n=1 Tax=Gymnodraco acuticeps TaxID=8218 RepID=A0A6P8TB16_GYMAC|nr:calpain-1 catalytic subunit-like [Gymnodraco acuticeps]
MPGSGSCTSIINLRFQEGSEGSPSNPAKFKNQDFAQLKDNHLRRGRQFVDRTFPPDSSSLGDLPDLSSRQEAQVKWLRPAEILKQQNNSNEAIFCTKGATRFDFGQGAVGNCWFLAAINSLTFRKALMVQVVPMDQNFNNHAGIFHFRFWRFGKWVDVVIDDYLPVMNNQLLSVRSTKGNEFWAPLMEKAYAKVCGSYTDMNAGLPSEACKDFCGGVNVDYKLQEVHSAGHDDKLWRSLSNASSCNSMICCGTAQKGGVLVNTVSNSGIVDAHAYSVTAVIETNSRGSKVRLVRLFNPWGRKEWTGNWSDKSDMWQSVSPDDREKCEDRNDGEFWMDLEDFCRHFSMLFICCENPNFIDGDVNCQWQSQTYDGKWTAGRSAGGSLSNRSFETNPQYRMKVNIIDKSEKEDKNIVLTLMQKPRQENRKRQSTYPIGISVFKIPPGTTSGRLSINQLYQLQRQKDTQMYTYARELVEMHSMEPGEYLIVPSTMDPYQSADFILTIFSKTDAQITPHDEDDEDENDHEDKKKEEGGDLVLPEVPTDNKKPEEETSDNKALRDLFNRYADQFGELKDRQLRMLLNDNFPHGTWNGFGYDTCSSMIAMFDVDKKMTMTLVEFTSLWKKINEYKQHFHRADVNKNGSLTDIELKVAIKTAEPEIDLNSSVVRLMTFRYSGFEATTMEGFISFMLRLGKTTSTFKDKSTDGVINLSWEEWTEFSMYN